MIDIENAILHLERAKRAERAAERRREQQDNIVEEPDCRPPRHFSELKRMVTAQSSTYCLELQVGYKVRSRQEAVTLTYELAEARKTCILRSNRKGDQRQLKACLDGHKAVFYCYNRSCNFFVHWKLIEITVGGGL